MENTVNYIQAKYFVDLISYKTRRMKHKYKLESTKLGSQIFPMYFGVCTSLTLSQNANHALILGHF